MCRAFKVLLSCVAAAVILGTASGCSQQSKASEFEQQIRAPQGPPPPEAAKAMADIQAAEARDKARGIK